MATLGPPAVIVFTEAAYRTAESIRTAFPDAEIYSRSRRVTGGTPFDDPAELLHALFTANRPIIGVCAAGILIRLLAPHLREKQDDPPVLAVSEDGQFCVPLLGGHNAGNRMASEIATSLQGEAAITTATDTRFGVTLDDPPHGWVLANPQDAKPFFASLLSGDCIRLIGDADWLSESDLPIRSDGKLKIEISDRKIDGSPRHLVYHRRSLALGVGCERGASSKELMALIDETLTNNELPRDAISGIWSIDLKMDEPAIAEAAANLGASPRFFSAETLEAETHRLVNPSEVVFREVGCHGVAEAAALAAAGPDAHLLVPKSKSRRATCAIARGVEALDAKRGVRRGSLSLVGIGPGSQEWRTAECVAILRAAEDVVGFTPYINLIEDLNLNASLHPYPIGAETDRVRAALDLAAEGRDVALVCSGDAGIYAMAALAYELIDQSARADWCRLRLQVAPGISALQAAAARVGAPLGHDFCAISLSDVLTPWPAIEKRIQAAAAGDFVIAFYNPVSKRRRMQLPKAREILMDARPSSTPVVLAHDLGRPEERIDIVTLESLSVDDVDMTTVVLIGASTTRRFENRNGDAHVYTPRGYGDTSPEGNTS